jgi:hypothetical protein
VVSHDRSFREAFSLVINRAGSYGVDVAPISLNLRMDLWIPVALGRRSVKVAGTVLAGNIKCIDSADGANKQGFDTKTGVVDWARRRGKVKDEADSPRIEGLSYIVLDEAEAKIIS